MKKEVLDFDSHEDVVVQLGHVAVADVEVADEVLLLLQLVAIHLKLGRASYSNWESESKKKFDLITHDSTGFYC